jgi:hypothetical protein
MNSGPRVDVCLCLFTHDSSGTTEMQKPAEKKYNLNGAMLIVVN